MIPLRRRVISAAAPLVLWGVAAWAASDPRLPSPVLVLERLWDETVSGPMPGHLAATLARSAAAFALAMIIGTGLGYAMGRRAAVDAWADGLVVFFLNLPALATIIIAYLWLGLGEAAAVIAAAAAKAPNVVVIVRQGARGLAPELDRMARLFRMDAWTRFRHVSAPQMAPCLLAAARSGAALIWKIVLVAELMGRPNGIGFQMHMMFQLFDVAGLLAYALSFIAVIQAVEHLIFAPLEARHDRRR